jgi:hypothetical protein
VSNPSTTPLSYNAYIQQIGVMAVVLTQDVDGVWQGVDATFNSIVPQMLNYAELRVQRDLDFLSAQGSNQYTLTAGNNVLNVPIADFVTVTNVQVAQIVNGQVVNTCPLTPVSREFLQNVYGGLQGAGQPKFFAMIGDNFGDGANTYNNIQFGPYPSYAFPVVVTGTSRLPSLATYAVAGQADTAYTTISQWFPDMLIQASMIYITAFQRNFSATSDSPEMGVTYEKQYQTLLGSALAEEYRKKGQGSGWSGYPTSPVATPVR